MRKIYFCLTLLSAGCIFETTEPIIPKSNVIWPLEIGNTWVYDEYHEEIDPKHRIDTMTVTGDTIINGIRMYILNDDRNVFCYNDIEGAWLHSPSYHSPVIALRYPVVVGQEFEYNEDVQVVVTSTNALVTVEAGTFECIKYVDVRPEDGIVTIFAAPRVGRVLEYTVNSSGDTTSREELMSFTQE